MTPLTAGYIYLLNFDSVVSQDADEFELNGKSAGGDYCYITNPLSKRESLDIAGEKTIFQGGEGYFLRYDKITEIIRCRGYVKNRTELKYIKEWLAKRQDETTDSDYLCIKYAASDYYPFYDENGGFWEYAKGWCKQYPSIIWNDQENQVYQVEIVFHVVWE